ncbi:BREX system ATP-binding domain-containing protein [Streptomyces sp. NPDC005498]|uniref:BREX system ATP-binding domain-containing protein n=1 Tax=unclassified Streptomyces TaxID=2593676 RepID=UPI0036A0CED5
MSTDRPERTGSIGVVWHRGVIDALRRGTVPESGLDLLATGLDRFEAALDAVASGASGGGAPSRRDRCPTALRAEAGSGIT